MAAFEANFEKWISFFFFLEAFFLGCLELEFGVVELLWPGEEDLEEPVMNFTGVVEVFLFVGVEGGVDWVGIGEGGGEGVFVNNWGLGNSRRMRSFISVFWVL